MMPEATDELLERIAHRLRAMANPLRLKILHSLEDDERSVSEILEQIGGSQANISKHLGVLRNAGLVAARRKGVSVYYRISDGAVLGICRTVCESLHRRASAEAETIAHGREAMLRS